MIRVPVLLLSLAEASPLMAQLPTLAPATKRYVSVEASVVAISNVLVVDGTGAPARRGQTVLLRDGRIEAVGPSAQVKAEI